MDPDMLCFEIQSENIKKATYLINNGHNLNEEFLSMTPLMWAIYHSNYIAKLLIKKGCDLNFKDCNDTTALMHSCGKNKDIMFEILKAKPDVTILAYTIALQTFDTFFDKAIRKKQYSGLKFYYLSELKS